LALDVGCGAGRFTRVLAGRAGYVFGLDISPSTVATAERLTAEDGVANVEYAVGDVRDLDLGRDVFDCIVSIACLHHLDLEAVYRQLAQALRPGGVLLVLDLVRTTLPRETPYEMLAAPLSRVLRLAHTGRFCEARERREAWRRHGDDDVQQLAIDGVRRVARRALPGADVRRRLLWRYSLVWRKVS
jgi:SAM-dependent methyltransferase